MSIRLDSSSEPARLPPFDAPGEPRPNPSLKPLIERRKGIGPAQLSFAQERLWFLDQIAPGDVLFNLSRGTRIIGSLDLTALQKALAMVVARHEILRTTFAKSEHHANTDGRPRQLIGAAKGVDLPVIQITSENSSDRDEQAREIAQAEARKPFDLALGPLLRPVLIRLDESDHVLLLNTHRIVADEVSLQFLVQEIWNCYQALTTDGAAELADSLLQFADYSEWERQWLQGEALAEYVGFWRQKLAGAPAMIELPMDRPRPPMQTSCGASCQLNLDEQQTVRLRELSRNVDVTLEDVVLTALQILLARYSRQTDIVVGLSATNRPRVAEQLIGPLANALVVRTDLSHILSFSDLLCRVKEVIREVREWEAMPFARLVEELSIDRSLSHSPLFQIMMNFSSVEDAGCPLGSITTDRSSAQIESFEFESGIASYDLSLHVTEDIHHVKLRLEYNTDLFDRPTAERMLRHLESILNRATSDPMQPIESISLLTAGEKQSLLDWNRTAVSYRPGSIVDLFEQQVKQSATSTALIFEAQSLTYEELNARANQLAHYLRKLGVGPDVRVGVCLARGVEMAVSVLAILKAGGAYVPLDPKYPAERLQFMLSDSSASVVLTTEATAEQLPQTSAIVVTVDRVIDVLQLENTTNLCEDIDGENLAYVIYTSGSTGWPKGVAMTHRALANVIKWQLEPPFQGSRTLQFASLSFDVSFQELFAAWCSGGTLLLISDEVRSNATAMLRFLSRQRVARLFLPFVYLQHLAEAAETNGITPADLREVITAGEQLEVTPQIARFFSKLPDCRLYNHYGPSETHVVTAYPLQADITDWPALPPIGRPIANTQIYIVDTNMTPVPVGVPGELLIGGANVSRGYLDRPEVTAERYVPNPFSREPGTRLYRTGDLARYRRYGNIDFLGRIDNQVKVRGFRIELGEIEAALRTHAAVRDVVVRPREQNDALVAYVIPDRAQLNGADSLSTTLRAHLGSRLPEYMVPAIFVELEQLPLTPSGKVDRRALFVPVDYRSESSPRVAPRDEIEIGLVQLWERVLQIKSIGVTDNFFELGGHSLLASRLFAQIENRFGRNLPLATLFQAPTIEQLAVVLRENENRNTWSSLVPIQPLGSRPPLFCVHAAGANVLIYRPLARHLGLDQPVYALQTQGLDGRTQPYTRVEDIAAHYLKDIRSLQPEGPYFLLGASFGGIVIYEMALQLRAQGQQVALLAMLNTDCPVVSWGKRIKCHVGNLRTKGVKIYFLAALGSLLGRVNTKAGAALETAAANSELKDAIESRPDLNDPLVRTVLANLEAEKAYVPSVRDYPGRITYFWARDAETTYEDNRLAWAKLAGGGFDLHKVPGDHATMREEPNVAVLVEKLKPALAAAQPFS